MDKISWGRSEFSQQVDQEKFKEFLNLGHEKLKEACQDKMGEPYHIVRSDYFDRKFLEKIYKLAKQIKNNFRGQPRWLNTLLSGTSALNYFHQPSSRTFLSFSCAETMLGIRTEEIRSIQTSSSVKGESDKDALRTISSYFDTIVCRHPSDIFDLFSVWVMRESDREIPIINAGSGTSEHPTQSLLDYYTIYESFDGKMDNLNIGFVGDCLRGRTVHSLAKVMSLYPEAKLSFIAPSDLQLDVETKSYLEKRKVNFEIISSPLEEKVHDLDVIYMTRIQDEHGGEGETLNDYKFKLKDLDKMKPGAILMHPMPKRDEIDPRIDYLSRDPRVMYWRQQRNGMWVRCAIFVHLFGKTRPIMDLT